MRHGETHWNKQGKIQGSSDIALTDLGVELAELSREGFACEGICFDRIYTSPLGRAVQTAQVIGEKTLKEETTAAFVLDDRIREMCFGRYEGLELSRLKDQDQNIVDCFSRPSRYQEDETGESYGAVYARVAEFMHEVLLPLEAEGVERALVVCHGTVIRVFLSLIKEIPLDDLWKMRQPNCSINLISLSDGKFSVVRENILYYESEDLLNRGIL